MRTDRNAPTQSNIQLDEIIELPAGLYFQILETALKTGKSEEEALNGLRKSLFALVNTPGQTELKGFALKQERLFSMAGTAITAIG